MRNTLISEVRSNNVLLHGSPKKIHQLLPQLTDEEVAICATPYPEIAIFMAVAGACKQGGRYGYSVSTKGKKNDIIMITFTLCEEKVAALLTQNLLGFVYTLDNQPFKKVDLVEYRTHEPLYTGKKFEVTPANLPFTLLEGETVYRAFTSFFYDKV